MLGSFTVLNCLPAWFRTLGRPNLKYTSLAARPTGCGLPFQGARRHRLAETTLPGDALSRESPQRASESPPTATACTLSVQGTTSSPGSSKGHMHFQQTILSCGNQKARSLHGPPTFDIVATAGLQSGRDALQHFPLPDKSGLFADMLGHLDFNGSGGTLSPKLLVRLSLVCQAPGGPDLVMGYLGHQAIWQMIVKQIT